LNKGTPVSMQRWV